MTIYPSLQLVSFLFYPSRECPEPREIGYGIHLSIELFGHELEEWTPVCGRAGDHAMKLG